jgi:NADH dehydrogenase/NADH:ubiquinone oxidoreductase subunit G
MVKTVILEIDGKEAEAVQGMTILEAAKRVGIEIPTLCYHEGLESYGACRICSVEIEKRGRTQVVAACCYPVEENLKVKTGSPKINKIRKTIIELAAVTAGEDVGGEMRALASKYNADLSRFRSKVPMQPTKCILCGLCVRRCIEANWDSAIGFVGRGIYRCVALFPEKAGICSICNYCRDVCPTGRTCSAFGPDPPFPRVDDVLAGRK